MLVRKRVVPNKGRRKRSRHRCCGLSVKDGLQFLSSLILPMMLGVFTVVITFQQQKLAQEQRIEDMNVARQRWLEDRNESRLHRDLDWNISQSAQAAQNKANHDQYQDEVLVSYIKEVGDLLEKKNGTLTSDPLTHTLARVKTLNAIRQLDGTRSIHILRFLHEAGQLTNTNESCALDISTAELTGTDFRESGRLLYDGEISLAGVHLMESTFSERPLRHLNFSFAELYNVNFSFAHLFNVNFSSALLLNVTFSSARLNNVTFSSAGLANVTFSSAELDNVNFSFARLDNVTFSSAELKNVNFSSARLVDFYGLSRFNHARMPDTIFDKCDFGKTDFSYANLKNSSFHSAMLSKANFFLANLENVDFTNSTITDDQLQSALSIRNAKLPNGTLGLGRNLVKNGDANCNISLGNHWQVEIGNIAVVVFKNDRNQCRFSLQSVTTGAIMSQRIALVDIWDSSFWPYSYVELQAQISSAVSIELIGKNRNDIVVDKCIANSTYNKISMYLSPSMQKLEVTVKFDAPKNKIDTENSWCDNMELFIGYGA